MIHSALPQGHVETEDFAADWRGVLFVRGHVAGEDSIARLCREFRLHGPEQAFALARGSFSLRLLDKRTQNTFFCSDPFALVQLFATENQVGEDLIELVRLLPQDDTSLDRPGLASFLRYGFYTLARTADRRVRVLGGGEIVQRIRDSGLHVLHKALPRGNASEFDFDSYVLDLRTAVAGQQISLDLTGGVDSRVLGAAFTHASIPLAECATMGTPPLKDLPIARRVAAALNIPHVSTQYTESDFERRIPQLLAATNGQVGLATYDHAFQFARERLSRGVGLAVSGVGGELWKDFWWLQDFPRLAGKPRFEWLYATRIEPRPPDNSIFEAEFAERFESARKEYLTAMTTYSTLPKTMAYDSVYAFLRVPSVVGPWVSATLRTGLPTLCPLLDIDGVRAAMHMRRRQRLFASWHRATISRLAPKISRIPTAEGTSTRAGMAALADVPLYVADKSLRLAQKVAQRLGYRDLIRRSLFDARTFRTDAVHELARSAIQTLAHFGVVQARVEPPNLSFPQFERVLTAGLLLQAIY